VLLEFGFRNFFSFREGATVSFRLDSNCPASISGGQQFSTVLGIKGANGAGKTHLLKALAFIREFCVSSFNYEPGGLIPFSSYFENRDATEIYVEFLSNGAEYRYELVLTDTEVIRETAFRTKARKTKIFERTGEKLETQKALSGLQTIKLRKNASIISTAHQYERTEISDIYKFFKKIFTNVGYNGFRNPFLNLQAASKFMDEHEEIFDFATKFISECDVGVSQINIMKEKKDEINETHAEERHEYTPMFSHRAQGKENWIHPATESSGTKAIFRALAIYKLALETGGIVVLDEFDIHLHPHILPKILELFTNSENNPKNAQLIVSTHDDRIMDILGKYRTILVNKEENESFAYRLDEIQGDVIRNDRSMVAAYNDGKIGGVPRP
jgi:AAA15 family ATPase/GTPase